MTLWGELEQVHVQKVEQLHAHVSHQNVTEHNATSGHRMAQKVNTYAQHR